MPQTEIVSFRCTPKQKEKILKTAQENGVTLTDFIMGCIACGGNKWIKERGERKG